MQGPPYLKDPELVDNDLFRGASFRVGQDWQECDYCGMWFSLRGIDSHEEACPVRQNDKLEPGVVADILDKCEECGYLGECHAMACSKIDMEPMEGMEAFPFV